MKKLKKFQGTIKQSYVRNFTLQVYVLMGLVVCLSMRIDQLKKLRLLGFFKGDSIISARNINYL